MITRFEKARVLSARTLQIAMGAPFLIKVPKGISKTEDIARLELEKGALPLTIAREMPDGSTMFLNLKGEEIGKTEK